MLYLIFFLLILVIIFRPMKIKDYNTDTTITYDDKVIGTDATTGKTVNFTLKQVNNPKIQKVSSLPNLSTYLDGNNVFIVNNFLEPGIYSLDIDFKFNLNTANNEVVFQINNMIPPQNPILEIMVNEHTNGNDDNTLIVQKIYMIGNIYRRVTDKQSSISQAFN